MGEPVVAHEIGVIGNHTFRTSATCRSVIFGASYRDAGFLRMGDDRLRDGVRGVVVDTGGERDDFLFGQSSH